LPTVALLLWPLISLGLFGAFGVKRGVILTVVIGYLFLPSSFAIDLPILPPYDKSTAITVGLVLGYILFARRRREEVGDLRSGDRMFGRLLTGLFLLYALTPVFTYLTNREGLSFGPTYLQGLRPWDAITMSGNAAILFVPFFVGLRVLSQPEDHRLVLKVLVGAGLFYSLLALFEVRMSPQLHTWVYGYFPHSFAQHIRGGNFRPVVFLNHGLALGLFLLSTLLASIALSRAVEPERRMMFLVVTGWFFLVLLISRNLGASLLAVLFVPVVLFVGIGLQARIAAIVAIVFLLYPAVRQTDVLPLERFTSFISTISAERASSFQTRLDNEQALLARALEKPLFGWGGYGRNRIFNEWGQDTSITDGIWIIELGSRGWVGYVGFFGLVTLPVLRLRRVRQRKEILPVTAGIAIIMAANFMDMVPNSTLSPIGLLLLGALAGFARFDPVGQPTEAGATEPGKDARGLRYTRFGGPDGPLPRAHRRP